MAQGDAVAGDVPGIYDCVINGKGYQFLDTLEPSIPFRTHRAIYAYSPTFVDRSNVGANYGDNTQDFWMTFSQNDWSLGEQQRFFHPNGQDGDTSKRRYWQGSNVNVLTPGQVSMQYGTSSPSFGGSVSAACASGGVGSSLYAASSTNLYQVSAAGVVTDLGAHGAGGTPSEFGLCSDGSSNVYIAGGSGNLIRKWNGAAFSTFSSSLVSPQAVMYLNNALYATTGAGSGLAQDLSVIDSSGNPTTLFTWKQADGLVRSTITSLRPFGGQLLICRYTGADSSGGELWLYDGTGVSRIAKFASNFFAYDVEVVNGVAFVAGSLVTSNQTLYQPCVYYYANGSVGVLWKANKPSTNLTHPTITGFQGGLVISDESTGNFLFYNPDTGGTSTFGSFSTGTVAQLQRTVGGLSAILQTRGTSTSTFYPTTTVATTATVTTSLYDFDSSLTKLFRGIVVDFDAATDGNGGSVDISYRVGDVDGSYTSLQVGATSGTEYQLTGITGRQISVKVTLNKGTSTSGPVLKRIYVRAAPELQQFRRRELVLDLSGIGYEDPVKLNDGTYHPLSGHEQASNLFTAITTTAPFTFADRFANFTGLCDVPNCEIYEVREGNDDPNFSGGFVAKITLREV